LDGRGRRNTRQAQTARGRPHSILRISDCSEVWRQTEALPSNPLQSGSRLSVASATYGLGLPHDGLSLIQEFVRPCRARMLGRHLLEWELSMYGLGLPRGSAYDLTIQSFSRPSGAHTVAGQSILACGSVRRAAACVWHLVDNAGSSGMWPPGEMAVSALQPGWRQPKSCLDLAAVEAHYHLLGRPSLRWACLKVLGLSRSSDCSSALQGAHARAAFAGI
jgi:hypothetical protein